MIHSFVDAEMNPAELAIQTTEQHCPQAVKLGELISLAARVEPALLRRMRLALLPDSDAAVEAELWFSPLIQSQNASGLMLDPPARNLLRLRLAATPDRLRQAWRIVTSVHRHAPQILKIEEEITFLALSGGSRDEIRSRLQIALHTLLSEQNQRPGLAQWAARILPFLPETARRDETAWLLAAAANARVGGPPILEGNLPDDMDPRTLRAVLDDTEPTWIGVRLLEDGIEFGNASLAGAKLLPVPKASPVVLEITEELPDETGPANKKGKARADKRGGSTVRGGRNTNETRLVFPLGERRIVQGKPAARKTPPDPKSPRREWRITTVLGETHVLRAVPISDTLSPAAQRLGDRLTDSAPKRILSLEGGGMRTTLVLGFLERIEAILREQHRSHEMRLADYFDLIVGSSVGGLIAAALACGMSVAEVRTAWHRLAPGILQKKSSLLRRLEHRYDDQALNRGLAELFGNRTLADDSLRTALCLPVKRLETDVLVSLINHPASRNYPLCASIMLRDAVRAGMAAPALFTPVQLTLGEGESGTFVDANVSMASDPAYHVFRIATSEGYPFRWQPGPDRILLVSIGSGRWTVPRDRSETGNPLAWATVLPDLLVRNIQRQSSRFLDSLTRPQQPKSQPPLRHVRYDVSLNDTGLAELGLGELREELDELRDASNPDSIRPLTEISERAAKGAVNPEDFPTPFAGDRGATAHATSAA